MVLALALLLVAAPVLAGVVPAQGVVEKQVPDVFSDDPSLVVPRGIPGTHPRFRAPPPQRGTDNLARLEARRRALVGSFAAFDTDLDGAVTFPEFLRGRRAGIGRLDFAERGLAGAELTVRRSQIFQTLDRDGDGRIAMREWMGPQG